MQIDSSVAEADVGGVAEEQDVVFTVDAYPDRTFHGEVTQVRNSPTTVNNVVTYDCVIGVTNSDYKLKPGMTANVSITVAQRENALTIPNGALRFRPPEDAVVLTNSVATRTAPPTNGGNFARGPAAVVAVAAAADAASTRFFTRSMCFPARVTMRSCRRCRSGPASATASRPRCFRGWTKARRS